MSKHFTTHNDFMQVISSISKDGSVILDLKNGPQPIAAEKQYPYVAEAANMDLDTAIKNLPTALRFDLIKEGYEFLIDELNFSELDGPNDYWSGRMTSYILRKFPQYEPKIDWSKMKNTWLVQVLIEQPHFSDRIDFSKLDARSFADLLAKSPNYSDKFDLKLLNTAENAQFWFRILEKQPQFATQCDWTLINDYQKKKLLELHPSLKID
jgi:hypothetical protein